LTVQIEDPTWNECSQDNKDNQARKEIYSRSKLIQLEKIHATHGGKELHYEDPQEETHRRARNSEKIQDRMLLSLEVKRLKKNYIKKDT